MKPKFENPPSGIFLGHFLNFDAWYVNEHILLRWSNLVDDSIRLMPQRAREAGGGVWGAAYKAYVKLTDPSVSPNARLANNG